MIRYMELANGMQQIKCLLTRLLLTADYWSSTTKTNRRRQRSMVRHGHQKQVSEPRVFMQLL